MNDGSLKPRAGLFVTCLIDLMRPSAGLAAARLIEVAGCEVIVPAAQTCCGQPAYNSGDLSTARTLALQTVRAFAGCEYVVAPSGSCAAMLKLHYPRLFEEAPQEERDEVHAFSQRVHELVSFLVNVRGLTRVPGRFAGKVAYHDACSAKRELGLHAEPRRLIASIEGAELVELPEAEACCGFGGLFSVKYPEISAAIVSRKTAAIASAGPDLLTGPDLGCLLNVSGRLTREGSTVACRHIAELLAGDMDEPPIGQTRTGAGASRNGL